MAGFLARIIFRNLEIVIREWLGILVMLSSDEYLKIMVIYLFKVHPLIICESSVVFKFFNIYVDSYILHTRSSFET